MVTLMRTPKSEKRKAKVTTQRRVRSASARKRVREWKIDKLARLIAFAYDRESDVPALAVQFGGLVDDVLIRLSPIGILRDWLDPAITQGWLDDLRWCQAEGLDAIQRAARKEEWTLKIARLVDLVPSLAWTAIGASGY